MTDEITVGEVTRTMEGLRSEVRAYQATTVTRAEYEAWRVGIEREMRDIKNAVTTEISNLRADIKNSRNQLPVWLSTFAALAASVAAIVIH